MTDNFTLRARCGDDFSLELQYTADDEDQTPIDLDGYEIEWKVSVGSQIHTYTQDDPEIVISHPTDGGTFTISLSGEQTSLFATSRGRFHVKITSPELRTLLEGPVEVEFNV